MTYRKNAMRERERSSPGEREEAKIERKTAGVTGMRLVLWGSGAPALVPGPSIEPSPACTLDMESGYGRCADATGAVETVGAVEYVAAAYDDGVIVLVLGVELVGVTHEPALERTDGDGEPTIAESILISMRMSRESPSEETVPTYGSRAD